MTENRLINESNATGRGALCIKRVHNIWSGQRTDRLPLADRQSVIQSNLRSDMGILSVLVLFIAFSHLLDSASGEIRSGVVSRGTTTRPFLKRIESKSKLVSLFRP